MYKLAAILCAIALFDLPLALAETPGANLAHDTLIVMPFENASGAPGLEWVGEAFAEILTQRLSSPDVFVLTRDDRLRAYDRAGIPANLHPTRATMYRTVEQMDVDHVVFGRYTFDGRDFVATAQVLNVQNRKLSAEVRETGALVDLVSIQTALAWDLLHDLRPDLDVTKAVFSRSTPPVRLDALENYVRGVISGTATERLHYFQEATRLNPGYSEAWFLLGKTYFDQHQYDASIAAFKHVGLTDGAVRESTFYRGLSSYYLGDFSEAQSAFAFVLSRLPLIEVDNNLGVVASRLGDHKTAMGEFQRAVQEDPNDADYHFNLGLALYTAGDVTGASRQMKECLALRPEDAEAASLLDSISNKERVSSASLPHQRVKQNYDENSFRQLMVGIQAAAEERLAKADPETHAEFYVGQGQELLGKGFFTEAEREFRQALALSPGNAEAHAGLARVLEARDDLSGARAEAEAALAIRVFVDPLLTLARLDLRDNRVDTASQSVDRALTLDPANPSALTLKHAVAAKLAEKAPSLPN